MVRFSIIKWSIFHLTNTTIFILHAPYFISFSVLDSSGFPGKHRPSAESGGLARGSAKPRKPSDALFEVGGRHCVAKEHVPTGFLRFAVEPPGLKVDVAAPAVETLDVKRREGKPQTAEALLGRPPGEVPEPFGEDLVDESPSFAVKSVKAPKHFGESPGAQQFNGGELRQKFGVQIVATGRSAQKFDHALVGEQEGKASERRKPRRHGSEMDDGFLLGIKGRERCGGLLFKEAAVGVFEEKGTASASGFDQPFAFRLGDGCARRFGVRGFEKEHLRALRKERGLEVDFSRNTHAQKAPSRRVPFGNTVKARKREFRHPEFRSLSEEHLGDESIGLKTPRNDEDFARTRGDAEVFEVRAESFLELRDPRRAVDVRFALSEAAKRRLHGGLFEVVVEVLVPVLVTEKRQVDRILRGAQDGVSAFERAAHEGRVKAALLQKGAQFLREDVFGREEMGAPTVVRLDPTVFFKEREGAQKGISRDA